MLNKSVTFDDAGYVGYTPDDQPPPSFMQSMGAALRQSNSVVSTIANPRLDYDVHDLTKIDPVYDPYKDIKGYEEYAPLFEHVYNQTADTALKQQIDQSRKDQQTLAQSGWTGTLLNFGASVIDLPTLIPGGALVRGGKIGFDALKSALAVGASAGLSTAIQETALQANQPTRTPEESAFAIGGSTILGGLLGAGLSKFFTHGEWNQVSKSLEEDLSGEVANPNAVVEQMVKRAQAAGAQSVDDIAPTLQEMGVGGPRAAQIVANATAAARLSPGIRTMLSPSAKVREIYLKMVDNPIYTTMNMEGKTLGADVENLVKTYTRGAYGDWKRLADEQYLRYRQSLGQNAITSRFPATGETLSKTQFLERVAQAGRRGDLDSAGNEFITNTAKAAREKVFDPLFERAKAEGLLPDDVKTTTAASYVTRMWNREKLIGEEPRFREIAREYFGNELDKIESMQKAGKEAPKTPDFINEADKKDYIEGVVSDVFNNLAGKGNGDIPEWLVPTKRGPLKERTFNIPDAKVEDFLHNDMEAILHRYSRLMAADIELNKKFGRPDMKDQFDQIAKDYEQLRAEAKTPVERVKLDAAEAKDVKHLKAFRDMLRGTYRTAERTSGWNAVTKTALTWNYMRLLGGVTLSSLTDATRIPMVHGLTATMKEALPILTSRVNGIRAIKIAKQDAKELGAVAESVMQHRLASMADLNDPYRFGNRFERYLDNTANAFTKMTGIGWWTDMMNTISAVMTENRVLKNAIAMSEEAGTHGSQSYSFVKTSAEEAFTIHPTNARANWIDIFEPSEAQISAFDSGYKLASEGATEAEIKAAAKKLKGDEKKAFERGAISIPSEEQKALYDLHAQKTSELPDDVVADLNNILDRIVPQRAKNRDALSLGSEIVTSKSALSAHNVKPGEKIKVAGSTSNHFGDVVVKIALDVPSPREFIPQIARHESIHALKMLGLFTKDEWSTLENAAIENGWQQIFDKSSLEESIAEAFGSWGAGKNIFEKFSASESKGVAAIFKKIIDFYGKLKEGLFSSKYDYETIFKNIESGEIGRRPRLGGRMLDASQHASLISTGNVSKLDKAERAYMAYLGIDGEMASRIAEQFKKYGVKENGIHGGNVSEWDDDLARRAFGAALNKDTDRTIVKPGMGDVPLWMKTNTGRLLTQFKSFGVASHQRVLIAGLQERPRRLMEGMVLGTAVGMMIGYLKMIERGDYDKANNLLQNPGKWVGDGLDRAGIFYLPFDVSNTADKVSASLGGPNTSISSIFSRIAGDKDHSGAPTRYASRDPIGAVAGPTAGLFSDLATILAAVSRHQLSKVDSETPDITASQKRGAIDAALRQIPGSALPGIRTMINAGVKPALQ